MAPRMALVVAAVDSVDVITAATDAASADVGDVLEDPLESEEDIEGPGKLRQTSMSPAVMSVGIRYRAAEA